MATEPTDAEKAAAAANTAYNRDQETLLADTSINNTDDTPVIETVTETPQVAETAMPTSVRPVLNQTAAGLSHRLTERLGERFAPGSVKVEPNDEGTAIEVSIYGKNGEPSMMTFGVTQLRLSEDPLNTVLTAMLTGFGTAVSSMMGDYDHNYEMSNAPVFDAAMVKARAVRDAAAAPLTQPEDRIERRPNYTPQPPTNPPVPGVAPVEADAQVAVVRSTDVRAVDLNTMNPDAVDPRLAASVAAGMQQALAGQAVSAAGDASVSTATTAAPRTRGAAAATNADTSGTTTKDASSSRSRTRT